LGDDVFDREAWDLSPDSVQRALDHLVPAGCGRVVREAFYGIRRFDELCRHTGLSAPSLSARIRELEARDLLERRPYRSPGARTREEYHLTERGRDLATVIVALLDWADRWLPGPDGPTVALVHQRCGSEVRAELACERGHRALGLSDLEARPGPGAQRRDD
ncbi:MAG: winged helix-turn-helix transcriptional regulator, partial [Dermatophilaceae bacterium]